MTKIAISALALMVATTSLAQADSAIPDDVVSTAAEKNVDPILLAGALNSLHEAGYTIDAQSYMSPAPQAVAASGRMVRVRLTYYVEYGVTASGGHPYPGSTACSYNFAFGTRFRLPDGEVFTCNDRGLLGSSGWLDLWRAPATVAKYGAYASAEVLP